MAVAFHGGATAFDSINASFLAQLCTAAYTNQESARQIVLQLGVPGFIWIDLTEQFADTYAIVAGAEDFVIIAFRGTKDFRNWMTDLQATPASFPWIFEQGPDVGDIHAGFGHALRDAWVKIRSALENIVDAPDNIPNLWLTGHSLGGALAVIAGAAFSMWSEAPIRSVSGIYTFGQPRVGLYQFCGNYDHKLKTKTFRFVNNQDLVPRVPFRGWDYADLGQMIHFDSNGKPTLQSSQWANFLNRSLQSFKEFFDIAGHAQTDVSDHDMSGYARLVQTNAAALDALKF